MDLAVAPIKPTITIADLDKIDIRVALFSQSKTSLA